MKPVRLFLVICFVCLVASCSLKPTWELAGKWEQEKGSETVEFTRDGTITLETEGTSLSTTYKFVDPHRIKINVGSFGDVEMRIALSNNDELSLTGPDGQVTKYRRLKSVD